MIANYWDDNRHRRNFFEDFAALKKFTPKQAKSWYQYKAEDFEEAYSKEAKALFSRYSWPEVLVKAFPEVRFDHTQFIVRAPSVDYSDMRHQKEFFGIISLHCLLVIEHSFV